MTNLNNLKFCSEGGIVLQNDGYIRLLADKNLHEIIKDDYVFYCRENIPMQEYLVLEYSCTGIRRKLINRAPLMQMFVDNEKQSVVSYDDIVMDSNRHRIAVRVPGCQCGGIEFAFNIDRRAKAEFNIYNIYTCSYSELPEMCSELQGGEREDYQTVDISEKFNNVYSCGADVIIDGGRMFDSDDVVLAGIPFKVAPDGNNIVSPEGPPKENDDIIMNFGVPSKRRLCRPVSRDSITEIDINMTASEIYFILTMSGKKHQRWGFATDGPIIGSYCGDVDMPLLADDVERFCVDIVYKDGSVDTAMPLNLSTGRHGISGEAGVYAVPCWYSGVEKIVLHNRMIDTDCSLVAVTVNTLLDRKYPEMLIPQLPSKIRRDIPYTKNIILENNILTIANNGITMIFDISIGMKLLEMKNMYTPHMNISQQYILKLTGEKGESVCHFELVKVQTSEEKCHIQYKYEKQLIDIEAWLDGDNGIGWRAEVHNNGDCPVRNSIVFPSLCQISYDTPEDGWYFFPKYQNINSNETVYIYEESAPSFPMQFFDIYSPSQQGGTCVITHEKGLKVRKYGLEKDKEGISAFVEYPSMYGEVLPGESFETTETVVSAHNGDWRRAFLMYTEWLRTWYKPYKCQDKKWYRQSFWLLAEIVDFFETEEFCNLPVWYDKDKKEFNFERILEEQREIAGCYPDILHLWSWAYKKEGNYFTQQWGNFGSSDYDEYGGVDNFRKALHSVRDKGVNVSLYLHPTLLSGRYPQAEKYFPKHRVVNSDGEHIVIEGDSYRMCHANDEWREYALSMYPRIYKELGIPLLYVDEFSLRVENRCYCDSHGHSVPSNLLKTDRDFITSLKKIMPEEVVLYGEYYAVDVNAAYIDCNISYYIIDSVVDMVETAWRAGDGDDRLGRVFTDVYRFAFPGIVQLILPMAMRNLSWHPQKFLFFNGEAIYDSFWDCEESRGLDFTVKAYKIKKQYADCFSSDCPETMVDTLSPALCANRFPGENRTVYTLYNRAYSTFRGKGLRIRHTEGNTYYDVWNDRSLSYTVNDGYADIDICIGAQEIGCIAISGCDI